MTVSIIIKIIHVELDSYWVCYFNLTEVNRDHTTFNMLIMDPNYSFKSFECNF